MCLPYDVLYLGVSKDKKSMAPRVPSRHRGEVEVDPSRGVGGQHHARAALPPAKKLCTHCTGSWVGVKAGLDAFRKPFPTVQANLGLYSP
jgi:hypothetical protein